MLNEALFAPARYIDKNGCTAHGPWERKFWSSPETKAGTLSAALLACFFVAASDKDMAATALGSGATFLLVQAARNKHNLTTSGDNFYYFDTKPEQGERTPPPFFIVNEIAQNRQEIPLKIGAQALLAGVGGGAFYLLTSNMPIAACLTVNFMAANIAGVVAKAWYNYKYVTQEWNALETLPPKIGTSPKP